MEWDSGVGRGGGGGGSGGNSEESGAHNDTVDDGESGERASSEERLLHCSRGFHINDINKLLAGNKCI